LVKLEFAFAAKSEIIRHEKIKVAADITPLLAHTASICTTMLNYKSVSTNHCLFYLPLKVTPTRVDNKNAITANISTLTYQEKVT